MLGVVTRAAHYSQSCVHVAVRCSPRLTAAMCAPTHAHHCHRTRHGTAAPCPLRTAGRGARAGARPGQGAAVLHLRRHARGPAAARDDGNHPQEDGLRHHPVHRGGGFRLDRGVWVSAPRACVLRRCKHPRRRVASSMHSLSEKRCWERGVHGRALRQKQAACQFAGAFTNATARRCFGVCAPFHVRVWGSSAREWRFLACCCADAAPRRSSAPTCAGRVPAARRPRADREPSMC